MGWIAENTRFIRALIAMAAAVALAVVVLSIERSSVEKRAETVRKLNEMLWSISELNFETQRMVNALNRLAAGFVDLETVQLRFDVLWSRVEVVRLTPFSEGTGFHALIAEYEDFLATQEPVLFGSSPPDLAALSVMTDALSDLTLHSRELWTQNLGSRNPSTRVIMRVEDGAGGPGPTVFAVVLIALLMVYVIAEVFFASRGQRREKILRLEAAQANETKSRFLANVSHEIRTPLNGILGMASELAETPLTDEQAQCLDVIEQSGGVLLGTINDVLDLSRIESGHMELEVKPYVLRDIVEAARALYSARAREKGLRLDLHVQENLPRVLVGDGRRLRQVLHNLIANAVKFADTGGVSIRVRPELEGGRLSIAVQDTGPGITREAQAKVFDPFAQADASVTRRHGGTGLGLAISRQLCESMGGSLSLVSRPGHGATFFIDLPLVAAPDDAVPAPEARKLKTVALDGMRLLVADDNATNRLVLGRFLKDVRAHLDFATNGKDALEQASERHYDAILMDVQMPLMDGVTATEEIRALEGREGRDRCFIVAVTANVLVHQVADYQRRGADAVLPKPVSKQALLTLLSDRLNARAA